MNEFKSLRKNWEFQAVYRNGKSKANRCFVMIIKKNDASSNRIGISVSKKVGNSIVRHRVTRVIREVMRLHLKEHMAMTYFADKINGKKRIILNLIIEVIVMLFAISVLIFGGISITRLTMTQVTASLGIPMGYVYAVVPISGVITVIYNILNISELFKQIKNA